MRAPRWCLLLLAGAGLAAPGTLAPPAAAEEPRAGRGREPLRIYKWVDENGIAHYTTRLDRIPEHLRDRIREPRSLDERPGPATEDWARRDADSGPVPPAPDVEGGGSGAGRPVAAVGPDLEARIAALEREIARDQERLKELISAPPEELEAPLPELPAFREIAQRLPRLQADLRLLRRQRAPATGM